MSKVYNKKHSIFYYVIMLLILYHVVGCKNEDEIQIQNFASKYQLNQTVRCASQFESAILYANAATEDTFAFRLVPTWRTSTLCPKFVFLRTKNNRTARRFFLRRLNDSIQECYYVNYIPVPVYLIDDVKLGRSENVFVPDGDRCILVNTNFIARLWGDFGLAEYEPDRRHSIALSLILLHELGHLNNRDAGSYISPQVIDIMPNGRIDLSKNKEYKADLFAVNEIKKINKQDTSSFREKVAVMSSDYLEGDFYRAINYGRSEFEINRDVLGVFSGKNVFPNFQTNSYSHPNLYLRFLLMSYILNPDPEINLVIQNSMK